MSLIVDGRQSPSEYPLSGQSKWALVASILATVAGSVIVALAALQLYGAVGSIGFLTATITGALAATAALSCIIWIAIQGCRQRPPQSAEQAQLSEHMAAFPSGGPILETIPAEVIQRIMERSNYRDLISWGLTSKATYGIMRKIMIARAEEYGYDGSDFFEAKDYVKRFEDLVKILPFDLDTAVPVMTAEEMYTYCGLPFSIDLFSKYLLKLIKNNTLKITPITPKNDHNRTLIDAIKRGEENTVKLLLTIGVDSNALNFGGDTPLCVAVGSGKSQHPEKKVQELVGILLEQGADLNAPSPNGSRPLHWAAIKGFNTVVAMLLEYGAGINDPGFQGMTALQVAANAGKKETALFLLANGAAPEGLIDLF